MATIFKLLNHTICDNYIRLRILQYYRTLSMQQSFYWKKLHIAAKDYSPFRHNRTLWRVLCWDICLQSSSALTLTIRTHDPTAPKLQLHSLVCLVTSQTRAILVSMTQTLIALCWLAPWDHVYRWPCLIKLSVVWKPNSSMLTVPPCSSPLLNHTAPIHLCVF